MQARSLGEVIDGGVSREPRVGFRLKPLPGGEGWVAGSPGVGGLAGGARGLIRGFDVIKVTASSYIVQTLQEMVSPDPQIIVVVSGAEPESQVQRTESGGSIIQMFWVRPKGE